jgi:hypothetical protein
MCKIRLWTCLTGRWGVVIWKGRLVDSSIYGPANLTLATLAAASCITIHVFLAYFSRIACLNLSFTTEVPQTRALAALDAGLVGLSDRTRFVHDYYRLGWFQFHNLALAIGLGAISSQSSQSKQVSNSKSPMLFLAVPHCPTYLAL